MIRKSMILFLLTTMVLLSAGCWNRRELNELAIAGAIGIDKAGNQIRLSVQVMNPGEIAVKKGGGGNRSPCRLISRDGRHRF
ncbi:spore germination protein KC [Paenibacillus sp. yr247]|uniref:Ger(x)C family spore germination protein n=1 Tax=Paenibacillus sp. yr247 TaxID=1761880 RepID=UPI0008902BDD|nr:hypothetical protein [Paenibacillus sp. yr247]SDN66931.1 spore germination protein KC [Paenibacillus sp. yr247]